MRQFVPMTDVLLYSAGGPPGPLVPYRYGLPCLHDPLEATPTCEAFDQRLTVSVSPVFTPNFSAVPALSSSTYFAGAVDG